MTRICAVPGYRAGRGRRPHALAAQPKDAPGEFVNKGNRPTARGPRSRRTSCPPSKGSGTSRAVDKHRPRGFDFA